MKNLSRTHNHVVELQKDLSIYDALLTATGLTDDPEAWSAFEATLPSDKRPLHIRVTRLLSYDTWLRKHRDALEPKPTRSFPFGVVRSKEKEELGQLENALLREMSSILIRTAGLAPGSIDRRVALEEVVDLAKAMNCGYNPGDLKDIRDDTSNETLYLLLTQWLETHPVEDEVTLSARAGLPTGKDLEALRAEGKARREEALRTLKTYGHKAKKMVFKAMKQAKTHLDKLKEETNHEDDAND